MPVPTVQDITTATGSSVSTLTISGHIVASGECLIVLVSYRETTANIGASGVTWNGSESLTLIGGGFTSGSFRSEIWFLAAPTATTANIVLTLNGTNFAVLAGAVSVAGSSATVTASNYTEETSNSPEITVTSVPADSIVLASFLDNASSNEDHVPDSPAVEMWEHNVGNRSQSGQREDAAGGGSVAVGITYTTSAFCIMGAAALTGAGGGGLVDPPPLRAIFRGKPGAGP